MVEGWVVCAVLSALGGFVNVWVAQLSGPLKAGLDVKEWVPFCSPWGFGTGFAHDVLSSAVMGGSCQLSQNGLVCGWWYGALIWHKFCGNRQWRCRVIAIVGFGRI